MIFVSIISLQNQDQDQNQKPGVRWQWGTARSDRELLSVRTSNLKRWRLSENHLPSISSKIQNEGGKEGKLENKSIWEL